MQHRSLVVDFMSVQVCSSAEIKHQDVCAPLSQRPAKHLNFHNPFICLKPCDAVCLKSGWVFAILTEDRMAEA